MVLVSRAADLRQPGIPGDELGPLDDTLEWLREHDIIGGLLRANVHLAQYVAQVCS